MEEIIKQLKKIQPSEEYKTHSLRMILSAPQNRKNSVLVGIFELFKLGAALGLTGALIMISLSGILPALNARILSPLLLSSLDKEKIKNEASQIDIRITVSEARYYNESLKKVAVALNETAKNGPGHLNSAILEKEMQNLNINGKDNGKNINELLNKLTL